MLKQMENISLDLRWHGFHAMILSLGFFFQHFFHTLSDLNNILYQQSFIWNISMWIFRLDTAVTFCNPICETEVLCTPYLCHRYVIQLIIQRSAWNCILNPAPAHWLKISSHHSSLQKIHPVWNNVWKACLQAGLDVYHTCIVGSIIANMLNAKWFAVLNNIVLNPQLSLANISN